MKKKKETERELTLRSQVQVLEAENKGLERKVAELEGMLEGARWEARDRGERCDQLADRLVAFQRKLLIIREVVALPNGRA